MKTLSLARCILVLALCSPGFAAEDGFKSLFNGKDLTGWRGNPDLWSVEDETIKGVTKADPKLTHNTFLVWTNGTVDDFELRLSYRIVNGNSGIQYRSKVLREGAQGPVVGGYQGDFEAGTTYSGILYEEQGRGILAQRGQKTLIRADANDAKKHKVEVAGSVGDTKEIQSKIKKEDWNDYVIIAKGNHLQHFINGLLTVDVTDEHEAKAAKSGVLALQIHVGPPMTVQFKNIRLKQLGKNSASADSLQKLAGKWVPVEATFNGESVSRETLDTVMLTIDGEKYTSRRGERLEEGTITIDASKTPSTLDMSRKRSNGEIRTMPAIYEFQGEKLRVCYAYGENTTRPTAFKSEPDSSTVLVTYSKD
jgi:uncharacterized protein (TIGR03067 family)